MNRTFAEINLDALVHNYNIIKKSTKAKVLCAVKANGYGHGVYYVARALEESGADYFAVADVDEGVELRRCGITKPCVILGYSDEPERVMEFDLYPSVTDVNVARKLSDAAVKCGKMVKIHIAVDTGMSRIGFKANNMNDVEASLRDIKKISELPNLRIDGIFSHFTTADCEDGSFTKLQFERFSKLTSMLENAGVDVGLKHICNSAAVMLYPEMHLDMVRPGIVLYGLKPSDYIAGKNFGFEPVMELKTTVTRITELYDGEYVGYGNTYQTDGKKVIATVGAGYADGYFRALSNKGYALCGNEKINIAGRICMDQCMFDVTNVNNIKVGDPVILFGRNPSADEIAGLAGTIGYELVCAVSRRVPRVYYRNGKVIGSVNPILENIVR